MVIQHNMSAMNANRQLGLTTKSLTKSSEKLSSGYKINRAADDAAGLSISEKMRKQIRGLEQASENIEDGISLCQVADGALHETVNILQRMRELAIQSANGTNSISDRKSIDMEITQLKREVDRIAETTTFNDAVYPLNAIHNNTISANSPQDYPNNIVVYEITASFIVEDFPFTFDGITYQVGETATVTGIGTNGNEVAFDGGWLQKENGIYKFAAGNFNSNRIKLSDLQTDDNGYLYYISKKTNEKKYFIYNLSDENEISPDPLAFQNKQEADSLIATNKWCHLTVDNVKRPPQVTQTVTKTLFNLNHDVSIHAGASASQTNKIQIHIVNATCKGLGITELTTATEKSSDRALVLLNDAISKVSAYRSAFGAVQNRLEHAQKIDDNTAENTQAAESQIRDANMADEMVQYANINILTQAGQSMLAQANQSKQGILNLVA